jgi:hypothetical protein
VHHVTGSSITTISVLSLLRAVKDRLRRPPHTIFASHEVFRKESLWTKSSGSRLQLG